MVTLLDLGTRTFLSVRDSPPPESIHTTYSLLFNSPHYALGKAYSKIKLESSNTSEREYSTFSEKPSFFKVELSDLIVWDLE